MGWETLQRDADARGDEEGRRHVGRPEEQPSTRTSSLLEGFTRILISHERSTYLSACQQDVFERMGGCCIIREGDQPRRIIDERPSFHRADAGSDPQGKHFRR